MKNPQFSFTAGELAPGLHARVDLSRYATALKACRNFIVRPQGGVDNRPGLRFVDEVANSANPVRLVPFVYSVEQSYVVEFGVGTIRFIRGGAYVNAETPAAWSSATTYALNGYALSGGTVYRSLQAGNINKTPASEPAWWVADPVYQIASPYVADDLPLLHYTQSADVLTIVCGKRIYDLKRYAENRWKLLLFDAVDGPFRDVNLDTSHKMAASAVTGNITITSSADVFTAEMVDGLVYFEEQELRNVKPWEPGERNVAVGQQRRSDFKTYRASSVPNISGLAGTPFYMCGPVRPTHDSGRAFDGPQDARSDGTNGYKVGVEWEYVHGGYGIAKITAFSTARSVSATVIRRLPDSCVGGLGSPSNTWQLSGDGASLSFSIPGANSSSVNDYEVSIGGVGTPAVPAVGGGGGTGSGGGNQNDWQGGAGGYVP